MGLLQYVQESYFQFPSLRKFCNHSHRSLPCDGSPFPILPTNPQEQICLIGLHFMVMSLYSVAMPIKG